MKTIFVVDDNSANLMMAEGVLSEQYEVITALSAAIMFELLEEVIPDLILLDIMMPDMDGFDTLKRLQGNSKYRDIPVMFLTGKTDGSTESRGFEMGVVDFIHKPFFGSVLLNRIKKHLDIEDLINERTDLLKHRTGQLVRLQNNITSVLADMVEHRDKQTGRHNERTAAYIEILLNAMLRKGVYHEELVKWNTDIIVSAAKLHDLGKIAVTDLILNKPGKLTPEEFELVKVHTLEGEKLIDEMILKTNGSCKCDEFLEYAKLCVISHHERWDGKGYPHGLKGVEIPLQGRIMAIADVYDALVNERPYKKPYPHDKAVEIIKENKGTHFDPNIVDVFLDVAQQFTEVTL
jgi:putative two-component system response regulator